MSIYYRTSYVNAWLDVNGGSDEEIAGSLGYLSVCIDKEIEKIISQLEMDYEITMELVSVFYQPVVHSNRQTYLITVIARSDDWKPVADISCHDWISFAANPIS